MRGPDLLYLVRDPWFLGAHAVPRVHYARPRRGEHLAVQCSCATPRESVMEYVADTVVLLLREAWMSRTEL